MIHYPAGTPLWVELVSSDIDASAAFYSDLFHWNISQASQIDGSRSFSSEGKAVSGVAPLRGESLSPQWITYLSTEDIVQTASHIEAAGGKVQTDPDETSGMMIVRDRVGAVFGLFQRDRFAGAHMFNQPVALTFNQLTTHEPETGKRFYAQVFGWQPRDRDMGGGFMLTYFFQGVRAIAGLIGLEEQEVPPHWKVFFAVENVDALVSRTIELGGQVLLPATDGPFGRSAQLGDPQGAEFSIIQQTPEVRAAAQTPMGVLPF